MERTPARCDGGRLPRPATAEELAAIVQALFQELTGKPIGHGERFYVEKYSHGGVSSGGIAPDFWRETAVPLLVRRYLESA